MNRKKTIILSFIIFVILSGTSFSIIYIINQKEEIENPKYIGNLGQYIVVNNISDITNINITNI